MGSSKRPQDATRQERKAKKRKLEDAVPDLPGDVEETADVEVAEKAGKKRKRDVEEGVVDDKERKERKKEKKLREKEVEAENGGDAIEAADEVTAEKKEKKSKKDKKGKSSAATGEQEITVEAEAEEAGPKKSKKERKAERRAKNAAEAAAAGKSNDAAPVKESKAKKEEEKANGDAATNGANGEAEKKSKKNNRNREKKRKGPASTATGSAVNGDAEKSAEEKDKKDARFICFIGNLPFSANTASITKHFAAVKPKSVRALTKKEDPTKSKGCAFIEFEGYDHMKTCLRMFHHSMFDDGVSAPRKINVELTAGGGGNTKERRSKIEEKNQKLNEQRARRIQDRIQEEEKAKLEKSNNAAAIDETAIHPSRRTRVPGA